MIFIIPLAIMIFSLVIITAIIIPKSHLLANIELEKLPQERNAKLKTFLLEKKLERKAQGVWGLIKKISAPLVLVASGLFSRLYKKIQALEQKYEQEIWRIKLDKEKDDSLKTAGLITELFGEAENSLKAEDLLEVEKRLVKILSIDPKNIKAYEMLGRLYSQRKEYDQAREIYEHILKINRDNIEAYFGLGELAAFQGEWQGASENYQRTVELDASNAKYYVELARAYQELKKNDLAREALRQAVNLEPNNPKYLDLLLETCIITSNKKIAVDTFKKLEKVNPENQKLAEFKKRITELK